MNLLKSSLKSLKKRRSAYISIIIYSAILMIALASVLSFKNDIKRRKSFMENEVIQRLDFNGLIDDVIESGNYKLDYMTKNDILANVGEELISDYNFRLSIPFNYDKQTSGIYPLDVMVIGDRKSQNIREFNTGEKNLVSGRLYNSEDIRNKSKVIVIDYEFAKEKGIELGHKLSLNYIDGFYGHELEYFIKNLKEDHSVKTAEFTVIGLYEDSIDYAGYENQNSYMKRYSVWFCPYYSLADITGSQDIITEGSYYIKSSESIEEFERLVSSNGLGANQTLKYSKDDYAYNINILGSIDKSMNILIFVGSILAAVLVIAIEEIMLKKRSSELLILNILGMEKREIYRMIILENLFLSIQGSGLGIVLWKLIVKRVLFLVSASSLLSLSDISEIEIIIQASGLTISILLIGVSLAVYRLKTKDFTEGERSN